MLRVSWRVGFAAAGILAYCWLAVPEFVRARMFCPSAGINSWGYACSGAGFPALSNLWPWFVPAPFVLLYLSSRLRAAVSVGAPFAQPRTVGWAFSPVLAGLALLVAAFSYPDWSLPRARIDLTSMIAWLIFGLYLAFLTTIRAHTDLDPRLGRRAFKRAGKPLMIAGLALYFGVFPIEVVRMAALSRACPQDSVCDAPAMAFAGFLYAVWLPGWPILIAFLYAIADRRGVKPWFGFEIRIGAALVGVLLIGASVRQAFGLQPIPVVLFYAVFGAWFIVVQYMCGRSARLAGHDEPIPLPPPSMN